MDEFMNYIPGKIDTVEQPKITLECVMNRFSGEIDEKGRIHLHCLCDGTYVFLLIMVDCLQQLCCKDIKTDERIIGESETPPGKPWCRCLFEASGILPMESEM